MDAMKNLLNTQITILILTLVGYILSKRKMISTDFRKSLTDLVINFVLPCNIIQSFQIEINGDIMRACLSICVVSAVTQVMVYLLSKMLFARVEEGKRPVFQYGTVVSNAGFLGSPIVEGLYGTQGLLYASIYLVPQRIMMWSVGVACFSGSKGKGVLKKVITHPCIIAVAVGLVLMLTQLQLPMWIDRPLELVGNCNTALSLLVIGGILAEVDPRRIVSRESLGYCLLRLVGIPLLVFAGCRLFGTDQLVMETSTVLAGMPAALTTAILASQYDRNEKFAVSLVFLSTIFSMVTIPLLCLFMMAVS